MLDVEALSEMMADVVAGEVAKAIAPLQARIVELEARPIAERGEKGEAGEAGERGASGADGSNGNDGKDGAGIADVIRDHEGNLVFTFTDGRMKALGNVNGKDGEPGKDGKDGFSLDNFDVQPTDERTLELIFEQGDRREIYELVFPVIIDKGVYKEGESYVRGDAVTWGGSLWIAQAETRVKPDGPDSGWRLAVKKGRDGKDAKNG